MQLWTWHEPDFDLTSGEVDHSRSKYYKSTPGILAAYAELSRLLGTDQIIWCYVRRDEYHQLPNLTRIEWALNVPDNQILGMIDAYVWNKILGIKTYPRSLYSDWLDMAPTDESARLAYINKKIEDYHSQPEPSGGWWSRLFTKDSTIEGATALLRHPIPEHWVIRQI
jgi:hypothetical protein